MTKIEFLASLPDITSAISLPGHNDVGARIKLDVPPQFLEQVMQLKRDGAGRLLRVTIEVVGTSYKPEDIP